MVDLMKNSWIFAYTHDTEDSHIKHILFYNIQYLMKSKNKTTIISTAAILAYVDFRFNKCASFLYFCDIVARLLALSSKSETQKLKFMIKWHILQQLLSEITGNF